MKDERKSTLVVYAAIAANVAIAAAKFSSAAVTGSSAMLSEGIHSTADSINELLLLLGLHRSRLRADDEHPFGHGKELYFWSLIVAVVLFGVGAGMAMYEGISHLLHPAPLRNLAWSLGTLGAAAVFEGFSFALAFRTRAAGSVAPASLIDRKSLPDLPIANYFVASSNLEVTSNDHRSC